MHPAMLDVRGDGRTTGRGPVRQPRRGSAAREHVIVIAQHVVRAAAAAAAALQAALYHVCHVILCASCMPI